MHNRSLITTVLALIGWVTLAGQLSGQTGRIEGRLLMPDEGRRTAARYLGVGAQTQVVPPVPVAVYLEGASAGPPPAGAPLQVIQQDTTFHPSLLVVPTGATVAFPNHDPFFHNVFSYSRVRRFDLGRYPEGEAKSVRFDRPGYVKVFCEIHEWMRAAILVVDRQHHATVREDGTFTLENVPPGRYRLVVVHFDRGALERPVEIGAGATARLELAF